MRQELKRVCNEFLISTAPQIPLDIAHLVSDFIVNESFFYGEGTCIRFGDDRRYAAGYEEYPLPVFVWPWPEFERDLAEGHGDVPDDISYYDRSSILSAERKRT